MEFSVQDIQGRVCQVNDFDAKPNSNGLIVLGCAVVVVIVVVFLLYFFWR
jgi:hypothetical protein